MRIIETRAYVGPNVHGPRSVLRYVIELGALKDLPARVVLAPMEIELRQLAPYLRRARVAPTSPAGRPDSETDDNIAALIPTVALALQELVGQTVSFKHTSPLDDRGTFRVVHEAIMAGGIGAAAGVLAFQLIGYYLPALIRPEGVVPAEFKAEPAAEEFQRTWRRRLHTDLNTAIVIAAAETRGIPWSHDDVGFERIGQGRFQQRLRESITDGSTNWAVSLSRDKQKTGLLLRQAGVPTPRQAPARTVGEAVSAAHAIGYPVVVKPHDGSKGKSVAVDLESDAEVEAAFGPAREISSTVIVESYVQGNEHRMLVVNGAMIAACRRVPGHVRGDGVRTIEELVAETNRDPRRDGRTFVPLVFDREAERMLAKAGLTRGSVPAAGEVVYLRSMSNVSTGGTSTDVTDIVHPDNRDLAERAALAIGLDIAGVDFITTDIAHSYLEVGGAICEINARPGLGIHTKPTDGIPRDVGTAIVDYLFPPGMPARVPVLVVLDPAPDRQIAGMLAHIMTVAGHAVALADGAGAWAAGRQVVQADCRRASFRLQLLREPTIDAAVFEVSADDVLMEGLGCDLCDTVVVAGGAPVGDLAGLDVESTARAFDLVVTSAQRAVVLGPQGDPGSWPRTGTSAPPLYVCATGQSDQAIGRYQEVAAVKLERDAQRSAILVSRRDSQRIAIDLPAGESWPSKTVEDATAAAAAALSIGVSPERIQLGLATLDPLRPTAGLRAHTWHGHGGLLMALPQEDHEVIARTADALSRARSGSPLALALVAWDGNVPPGGDQQLRQLLSNVDRNLIWRASTSSAATEVICACVAHWESGGGVLVLTSHLSRAVRQIERAIRASRRP